MAASSKSKKISTLKKVILSAIILTTSALASWATVDVLILRWRNPQTTAYIEFKKNKSSSKVKQRSIPLTTIPKSLQEAILVIEDAKFYNHIGLDFKEIRESIKTNYKAGYYVRGASTITQQLARNLYLSPDKSIIRKIKEIAVTLMLEMFLSKERILELYINYIEWGPNIYGCEAAAKHYYNSACASLSPEEAIRLTSIIINPLRFTPDCKKPRIIKRRHTIAKRMLSKGVLSREDYQELSFK